MLDALASPHDKVVAVASSALEYHVKPTHLRDLLSLLKPARAVRSLMRAFTASVDGPFVASHWRRGDRGHPEMGEYAKTEWELSQPMHFACLVSEMVARARVKAVLVMTNTGRALDRHWLRSYVRRWSGARVVYLQDFLDGTEESHDASRPDTPSSLQANADSVGGTGAGGGATGGGRGALRWERWNNYDVLVAELLLSAAATHFVSAGPSYKYASTLSRFVEDLRDARGQPRNSSTYMYHCRRPHPPEVNVAIRLQSPRCSAHGSTTVVAVMNGLVQGTGYQVFFTAVASG